MQRSVLILIPAHNEQDRIGSTLDSMLSHLNQKKGLRARLVVVLNGCDDGTQQVVDGYTSQDPRVDRLVYHERIGKGGALIEGLKLWPTAEVVAYIDADGSCPPEEITRLIEMCGEDEMVIGSRWLPESEIIEAQSPLRRFLSRGFHWLVQGMFGMGIRDTQCPAKAIGKGVLRATYDRLNIADFAFDVNLLYSAHKIGFRIRETPIAWRDVLGSKVTANLGRASTAMFLSIVRLRLVDTRFYRGLAFLRPFESWVYQRLGAPVPRRSNRIGTTSDTDH